MVPQLGNAGDKEFLVIVHQAGGECLVPCLPELSMYLKISYINQAVVLISVLCLSKASSIPYYLKTGVRRWKRIGWNLDTYIVLSAYLGFPERRG